MSNFKRWAGRASVLTATTVLGALAVSGIAAADTLQDTIADTGTGVTLVAGSGVSGSAGIKLVGNNAQQDPDPGCNIDASESPLVLDIVTPAGVTASPDPLTITTCDIFNTVSFTASASAVSGDVTVTVISGPAGGGTYLNQVDIPITVTQPAPTNTKPSVTVTGVADGATYDVGSVPDATCDVTDAEDGNSSFAAALSDVTGPDAVDGIGSQTASCYYKDGGGLVTQASVTYSIVDPTAPAITYVLSPATPDGQNGWYTGTVNLTWTVTEDESPNSLSTSGCDPVTVSVDQLATDYTCSASSAGGSASPVTVTIKRDGNGPDVAYGSFVSGTEGANGWYTSDVTVSFTATDLFSGVEPDYQEATTTGEGSAVTVDSPGFTDNAGNTTEAGAATSDAFKIDKTAPHDVTFSGGPAAGGSYYYGDGPAAPTCDAMDDVSGLLNCVVTGGGTGVGSHTYTATATDLAGNSATLDLHYTVMPWSLNGFYQPVDMNGVWNTVKGGSTVPLKFEIFAGLTEKTDNSAVKWFTQQQVACPNGAAVTDAIEITTTGGTNLRYDTTGGQFVQNWATPKKPGTCYVTTMTAQDGSTISARFILK